ncbi:arylamine N-acetyltransferase 1 [Mycena olivaceomarginata]|nr:arylamine N-acetyltransferase 1 [Mycena olivaceomarginata]
MSFPADPYAQAKLNRADAGAYLERIKLPATLLDSPPSLSLLVHAFPVSPRGNSEGHKPTSRPGGARIHQHAAGASAFDRIVHENKGAFLRYFGFTISELVGRSFKSLGNDPTTHPDGWKWGTLTHQLLVAGWPDHPDRYLIDGAWGPWNLAKPLVYFHYLGLNDFEAYRLSYEELPLSPHMTPPVDNIPGYTLYRRIAPVGTPHALPITPNSPGYWSPLFHFLPVSVPLADFALMAAFTAFWLITRIIPGSGGARRSMMYAEKAGEGTRAKVYTTGGPEAQGSDEGRDVEWVEMDTGTVKAYLTKEFGFKF